MTKSCEKGQVLVFGIFMIFVSFIFCFYISSYFELRLNFYSESDKINLKKINELSYISNILNQISVNNLLILTSVTQAQKTFIESMELGIYQSFQQPYWETFSIRKKDKKKFLSLDKQKNIQSEFSAYSLKTARSFYIARSLTKKNEELLSHLPEKIRKHFVVTKSYETFCMSIDLIDDLKKNKNTLKFFSKNYYKFNLEIQKDSCIIEHNRNSFLKNLEYSLPILNSSGENEVFNFGDKKIIPHNPLENIGVSYVSWSQNKNFINSLFFDNEIFYLNNKNYNINNFFNKFLLNSIELNANAFNSDKFFITHKKIYCYSGNSNACSFRKKEFYIAFFKPNWSVSGVFL